MATMKIEDAERVGEVNGEEIVPVSKGGAPKSMTVEQMKEHVMAALSQATGSEIDFDTDRIVVSRKTATSNRVFRVDAVALAEAVLGVFYGRAVGKEKIDGTWMVTVGNADEKKSVSLADLAEWVKDMIGTNVQPFDIGSLDEFSGETDGGESVPFAKEAEGKSKNWRMSLANFANAVCKIIFTKDDSTEAPSPNDRVIVRNAGGGIVTKTLASLGIMRTVERPKVIEGQSVESRIATFGSADGSRLDASLKKADSITDKSTTSEIPSAPAVKAYVNNKTAGFGDVKGPNGVSTTLLAQYADKTGKVLAGGPAVTSAIEGAYDMRVPTEKAVKSYVDGQVAKCAKNGSSLTQGRIATIGQNGVIEGTLQIAGDIDPEQTTRRIPSEKAVADALVKKVGMDSVVTESEKLVVAAEVGSRNVKQSKYRVTNEILKTDSESIAKIPTAYSVVSTIYNAFNGSSLPGEPTFGPILISNRNVNEHTYSKNSGVSISDSVENENTSVPTGKALVAYVSSAIGGGSAKAGYIKTRLSSADPDPAFVEDGKMFFRKVYDDETGKTRLVLSVGCDGRWWKFDSVPQQLT